LLREEAAEVLFQTFILSAKRLEHADGSELYCGRRCNREIAPHSENHENAVHPGSGEQN
jgi:hypothetical protein